MLRKHKTAIKVCAFILTFKIALADVLYAAPIDQMNIGVSQQSIILQDPSRLEAPLDFTTLKEIYKSPQSTVHSPPSKLIIHIQDAHSNYSGQQNLASALDQLMEKYKISLVLVEGGTKDDTLTTLKAIAPTDVWKRVAKKFLMEGKIAGEEYLNLTSDHPMKIMGIEDRELYMKSLNAYSELAGKREDILLNLKRVRIGIEKIKNKVYPEELKEYERQTRDQRLQTADKNLEEGFKKLLSLRTPDERSNLNHFPNVQKLADIQQHESTIDFNTANLEQAALVEQISKMGGKEDLKSALAKISKSKNSKLSQLNFVETLFRAAKEKNITFDPYPNLVSYEKYLQQFGGIDFEKFFEEYEGLEDEVYRSSLQSLVSSPQSQDALLIRSIDRYLGLLETAYRIQMSTKEFEMFKLNEPDFATTAYLAFINRKLADLGYFDNMIAYESVFEDAKVSLEHFYQSVSVRDDAFIKNTERVLSEDKQEVAILIAGGYHTQHLQKLFKEKGYSYAVLAPHVTSETNQRKYEKVLLEPIESSHQVTRSPGHKNGSADRSQRTGVSGQRTADRKLTSGSSTLTPDVDGIRAMAALESGARLAEIAKFAQPDQELGARLALGSVVGARLSKITPVSSASKMTEQLPKRASEERRLRKQPIVAEAPRDSDVVEISKEAKEKYQKSKESAEGAQLAEKDPFRDGAGGVLVDQSNSIKGLEGYSVKLWEGSNLEYGIRRLSTSVTDPDGQLLAHHVSDILFEIHVSEKRIFISRFFPKFPMKGSEEYAEDRGRALLRWVLMRYPGYTVISFASTPLQKSFKKMEDFQPLTKLDNGEELQRVIGRRISSSNYMSSQIEQQWTGSTLYGLVPGARLSEKPGIRSRGSGDRENADPLIPSSSTLTPGANVLGESLGARLADKNQPGGRRSEAGASRASQGLDAVRERFDPSATDAARERLDPSDAPETNVLGGSSGARLAGESVDIASRDHRLKGYLLKKFPGKKFFSRTAQDIDDDIFKGPGRLNAALDEGAIIRIQLSEAGQKISEDSAATYLSNLSARISEYTHLDFEGIRETLKNALLHGNKLFQEYPIYLVVLPETKEIFVYDLAVPEPPDWETTLRHVNKNIGGQHRFESVKVKIVSDFYERSEVNDAEGRIGSEAHAILKLDIIRGYGTSPWTLKNNSGARLAKDKGRGRGEEARGKTESHSTEVTSHLSPLTSNLGSNAAVGARLSGEKGDRSKEIGDSVQNTADNLSPSASTLSARAPGSNSSGARLADPEKIRGLKSTQHDRVRIYWEAPSAPTNISYKEALWLRDPDISELVPSDSGAFNVHVTRNEALEISVDIYDSDFRFIVRLALRLSDEEPGKVILLSTPPSEQPLSMEGMGLWLDRIERWLVTRGFRDGDWVAQNIYHEGDPEGTPGLALFRRTKAFFERHKFERIDHTNWWARRFSVGTRLASSALRSTPPHGARLGQNGESKLIPRIAKELDLAFKMHAVWPRALVGFGSARSKPGDPNYELARRFGFEAGLRGFSAITGAGPGIMEAFLEGYTSGRDERIPESYRWIVQTARKIALKLIYFIPRQVFATFPDITQGVKIEMRKGQDGFEQDVNPYVESVIGQEHFITRKFGLYGNAEAYFVFPGGIGTVDEMFDAWKRSQKSGAPLVFIGKEYWQPVLDVYFRQWKEAGLMNQVKRRGGFVITDDPDEALDAVVKAKETHPVQPSVEKKRVMKKEVIGSLKSIVALPRAVTVIGRPRKKSPLLNELKKLTQMLAADETTIRAATRGPVLETMVKAVPEARLKNLQAVINFTENDRLTPGEQKIRENSIYVEDESNHQLVMSANSHVYVVLPGAVGTMSKLWDLVTIMQTSRITAKPTTTKPIILMGRKFWDPIIEVTFSVMEKAGMVSQGDRSFLTVVDTAEEAYAIIQRRMSVVSLGARLADDAGEKLERDIALDVIDLLSHATKLPPEDVFRKLEETRKAQDESFYLQDLNALIRSRNLLNEPGRDRLIANVNANNFKISPRMKMAFLDLIRESIHRDIVQIQSAKESQDIHRVVFDALISLHLIRGPEAVKDIMSIVYITEDEPLKKIAINYLRGELRSYDNSPSSSALNAADMRVYEDARELVRLQELLLEVNELKSGDRVTLKYLRTELSNIESTVTGIFLERDGSGEAMALTIKIGSEERSFVMSGPGDRIIAINKNGARLSSDQELVQEYSRESLLKKLAVYDPSEASAALLGKAYDRAHELYFSTKNRAPQIDAFVKAIRIAAVLLDWQQDASLISEALFWPATFTKLSDAETEMSWNAVFGSREGLIEKFASLKRAYQFEFYPQMALEQDRTIPESMNMITREIAGANGISSRARIVLAAAKVADFLKDPGMTKTTELFRDKSIFELLTIYSPMLARRGGGDLSLAIRTAIYKKTDPEGFKTVVEHKIRHLGDNQDIRELNSITDTESLYALGRSVDAKAGAKMLRLSGELKQVFLAYGVRAEVEYRTKSDASAYEKIYLRDNEYESFWMLPDVYGLLIQSKNSEIVDVLSIAGDFLRANGFKAFGKLDEKEPERVHQDYVGAPNNSGNDTTPLEVSVMTHARYLSYRYGIVPSAHKTVTLAQRLQHWAFMGYRLLKDHVDAKEPRYRPTPITEREAEANDAKHDHQLEGRISVPIYVVREGALEKQYMVELSAGAVVGDLVVLSGWDVSNLTTTDGSVSDSSRYQKVSARHVLKNGQKIIVSSGAKKNKSPLIDNLPTSMIASTLKVQRERTKKNPGYKKIETQRAASGREILKQRISVSMPMVVDGEYAVDPVIREAGSLESDLISFARDMNMTRDEFVLALGGDKPLLPANRFLKEFTAYVESRHQALPSLALAAPSMKGARLSDISRTTVENVLEQMLRSKDQIPDKVSSEYIDGQYGHTAALIPDAVRYEGDVRVLDMDRRWSAHTMQDVYSAMWNKVRKVTGRSNDPARRKFTDEETEFIQRAAVLAFIAYQFFNRTPEGRFRRFGSGSLPYIVHPTDVLMSVAEEFDKLTGEGKPEVNAVTLAAAILHDVVEDTELGDLSHEDLIALLAPPGSVMRSQAERTWRVVNVLSKKEGEEETVFLRRMISSYHAELGDDKELYFTAILIKLADRLNNIRHNLDLVSKENLDEELVGKLIKDYRDLMHFIKHFVQFAYRTGYGYMHEATWYWRDQVFGVYRDQFERIRQSDRLGQVYADSIFSALAPSFITKMDGAEGSRWIGLGVSGSMSFKVERLTITDETFDEYWNALQLSFPPVTHEGIVVHDPEKLRKALLEKNSPLHAVALIARESDGKDHIVGGYLYNEYFQSLDTVFVGERYRGMGGSHILFQHLRDTYLESTELVGVNALAYSLEPQVLDRISGYSRVPKNKLEEFLTVGPTVLLGREAFEHQTKVFVPGLRYRLSDTDQKALAALLRNSSFLKSVEEAAKAHFRTTENEEVVLTANEVVPRDLSNYDDLFRRTEIDGAIKVIYNRYYKAFQLMFRVVGERSHKLYKWPVVVKWIDTQSGMAGFVIDRVNANASGSPDLAKQGLDLKKMADKAELHYKKTGNFDGLAQVYGRFDLAVSGEPIDDEKTPLKERLYVILEENAYLRGFRFSDRIDRMDMRPDERSLLISAVVSNFTQIFLRTGVVDKKFDPRNIRFMRQGKQRGFKVKSVGHEDMLEVDAAGFVLKMKQGAFARFADDEAILKGIWAGLGAEISDPKRHTRPGEDERVRTLRELLQRTGPSGARLATFSDRVNRRAFLEKVFRKHPRFIGADRDELAAIIRETLEAISDPHDQAAALMATLEMVNDRKTAWELLQEPLRQLGPSAIPVMGEAARDHYLPEVQSYAREFLAGRQKEISPKIVDPDTLIRQEIEDSIKTDPLLSQGGPELANVARTFAWEAINSGVDPTASVKIGRLRRQIAGAVRSLRSITLDSNAVADSVIRAALSIAQKHGARLARAQDERAGAWLDHLEDYDWDNIIPAVFSLDLMQELFKIDPADRGRWPAIMAQLRSLWRDKRLDEKFGPLEWFIAKGSGPTEVSLFKEMAEAIRSSKALADVLPYDVIQLASHIREAGLHPEPVAGEKVYLDNEVLMDHLPVLLRRYLALSAEEGRELIDLHPGDKYAQKITKKRLMLWAIETALDPLIWPDWPNSEKEPADPAKYGHVFRSSVVKRLQMTLSNEEILFVLRDIRSAPPWAQDDMAEPWLAKTTSKASGPLIVRRDHYEQYPDLRPGIERIFVERIKKDETMLTRRSKVSTPGARLAEQDESPGHQVTRSPDNVNGLSPMVYRLDQPFSLANFYGARLATTYAITPTGQVIPLPALVPLPVAAGVSSAVRRKEGEIPMLLGGEIYNLKRENVPVISPQDAARAKILGMEPQIGSSDLEIIDSSKRQVEQAYAFAGSFDKLGLSTEDLRGVVEINLNRFIEIGAHDPSNQVFQGNVSLLNESLRMIRDNQLFPFVKFYIYGHPDLVAFALAHGLGEFQISAEERKVQPFYVKITGATSDEVEEGKGYAPTAYAESGRIHPIYPLVYYALYLLGIQNIKDTVTADQVDDRVITEVLRLAGVTGSNPGLMPSHIIAFGKGRSEPIFLEKIANRFAVRSVMRAVGARLAQLIEALKSLTTAA